MLFLNKKVKQLGRNWRVRDYQPYSVGGNNDLFHCKHSVLVYLQYSEYLQ